MRACSVPVRAFATATAMCSCPSRCSPPRLVTATSSNSSTNSGVSSSLTRVRQFVGGAVHARRERLGHERDELVPLADVAFGDHLSLGVRLGNEIAPGIGQQDVHPNGGA